MDKAWKRTEDLIEQCLAAILQEGSSIEDCLDRYPDRRAELEPLLRTAARFESARSFQAPAQFRAAALQRLQEAASKSKPRRQRGSIVIPAFFIDRNVVPTFSFRLPRLAVLLPGLLLMALIVAGVGTAAASAQALPGDFLYPLKRAQESVQLSLTWDAAYQAELHLEYANRRMTEAVALIEQNRTSLLDQALADYDRHMQTELAFLTSDSGLSPDQQSVLASKLLSEVARYETNLAALKPETPPSAQSNLESALATSRKAYNQAIQVIHDQDNDTRTAPPGQAPAASVTHLPPTLPATATRLPPRVTPTATTSPRPSSGNLPGGSPTPQPAVRVTATLFPTKVTPTNGVTLTSTINSSNQATATNTPAVSNIKPTFTSPTPTLPPSIGIGQPTATLRTGPDPWNNFKTRTLPPP